MSLVTRDLSLRLGDALALDRIDAAFARGRVTAILGPNGAGKSSLLTCLAGLHRPSSGTVELDGAAFGQLDRRDVARRIGYLAQTPDVHWDIDVATLISLGRFPHRGRLGSSDADRAAIADAMAATDTVDLARRVVNSLSGGERGRALLARVLAGTPDWLLADEPLASLDPAHQLDVLDCLRAVAGRGAGVVIVLHDLNQASRVADDVMLMRQGRVIAHGPREEVLTPERVAEAFGVATIVAQTPQGQRFLIATGRA